MYNQFFFFFFILLWAPFISGKQAWNIDSIEVEISSNLPGISTRKYVIPDESAQSWSLGNSDTLSLSFNVKRGSHLAQPHQSMLLIGHPEKEMESVLVVPVDSNGKARLVLNHNRIPLSLLFSETPLSLTLVIGSFGDTIPLLYELGKLEIVDISNEHEMPTPPIRYGPLSEISHTFSPKEKEYSKVLSLIFSGAISIAFIKLFKMLKNTSFETSSFFFVLRESSFSCFLFFLLLLSIEFLFYLHWTSIRLLHTLAGILIISPLLFLSGRKTLSEIQRRRT
ncbi:hypothetical protein PNEG_02298 [Pneumocystis murina B123]|uniref:Ribophorin II C-terminal domain-containing protein n=1 Tax=Pneumocystis murina (strain B123) TaxID=1069680 RepID=M7PFW6_PNEMU|nr:hypothetical protein PNEG_02298 [Pneumocystis murina B123]EMR09344.1 hypothetical protein PNEG_02298 [Pneumocystis murina B123]